MAAPDVARGGRLIGVRLGGAVTRRAPWRLADGAPELGWLTGSMRHKVSERGIHEKWRCPPTCGKHTTSVPRHNEVTAGVVGNLIRDLACLPKGWLQ